MDAKLARRMSQISPFYVMALLARAKELEQFGRDIIHLEIGEPDFPTPVPIIAAGLEQIATGQVKYTPAAGLPALREKIVAFYQTQYGVCIAKEQVFITPGASGAFLLAFGITLNPEESILMADPCYPCNSNFSYLFNGQAQLIPVTAADDYQLTAAQIQSHWQAHSKGVLIASPANPTGTLIKPAVLKRVIDQTAALGGCFFSDEIYHGLVYGQQATCALQLSQEVFVINSFSKYFGMTGWRVGWLIVPPAFIGAAEKLAQNIFISTATASQYAALAAFAPETLQELERRRVEFAARRDFLYQALQDLGFKIAIKPEGAFYLYANCQQFTEDSFQFAHDLLEATGVALTPGKDFGQHAAQHHLRFAYTTSLARLQEAVQRLQQFINGRKG